MKLENVLFCIILSKLGIDGKILNLKFYFRIKPLGISTILLPHLLSMHHAKVKLQTYFDKKNSLIA